MYRSNTAYDRYYEGRKLWTDIKNQSRILTRNICTGIKNSTSSEDEEKREVIRFIMAYAVAVKHYLRGEVGHNYPDFHGLLSPKFLFRFKTLSYQHSTDFNTSTATTTIGNSTNLRDMKKI